MNSYISNFKLFIVAIILTTSILFTLVYLLTNFYLNIKPNNNEFIEYMKESKSRHMLNKYNFISYEKIFVGSSKTQYHISRNIFKNKNINIYNYGVSGSFFYDFPYMVKKSVLLNPKEIVISIPITDLYSKNISAKNFRGILFEDFKYIIKTHSFKDSIIAFKELIKNLYLPFLYSQNINSKIKQIYQYFNFQINKKPSVISERNKNEVINVSNNQPYVDCVGFYVKESIINCTNGDGILFGNLKILTKSKKKIFLDSKELNINKIKLLNLLQDSLDKKNIKLILIFEPRINQLFIYDKKLLNEISSFRIINTDSFETKSEYWKDQNHFNSLGRKRYTEFLLNYLN